MEKGKRARGWLAEVVQRARDWAASEPSEPDERERRQLLQTAWQQATGRAVSRARFADILAQMIVCGRVARCLALPDETTAVSHPGAFCFADPVVEAAVEFEMRTAFPELDQLCGELQGNASKVDAGLFENVLTAYDRTERLRRGVFYTPTPIAAWVIAQTHQLLLQISPWSGGLADPRSWDDIKRLRVAASNSAINGSPSAWQHTVPDAWRTASSIQTDPSSPAVAQPSISAIRILDPAAGDGVFLKEVIRCVQRTWLAQRQLKPVPQVELDASWNTYVAHGLLPRLTGFELMLPAAVVAHWQLVGELFRTGYRFASRVPIDVRVVDTLAGPEALEARFGSAPTFNVVVGNPPYAGISDHTGSWIRSLLRGEGEPLSTASYYHTDQLPLRERKLWLQDDYVKFIRYAQWCVDRAGWGVVGLVTNHGYLDNVTFRGMRQALLKTFSTIRVLDLHGNAKKREKTASGQADGNPFTIEQGIAIGIFGRPCTRAVDLAISRDRTSSSGSISIAERWEPFETVDSHSAHVETKGASTPTKPGAKPGDAVPLLERATMGLSAELHRLTKSSPMGTANADDPLHAMVISGSPYAMKGGGVKHGDLWGTAEAKLQALANGELDWRTIQPEAPHFFFTPGISCMPLEYALGWRLVDLMPIHTTAPVTARDGFVIGLTREELVQRLQDFRDPVLDDTTIRQRYFRQSRSSKYPPGDTRGWQLARARRGLMETENWEAPIRTCWYRPWDRRFIYWCETLIDWPRNELMGQFDQFHNLALIARRQMPTNQPANFFWVTDQITLDGIIRSDNRGSESIFPLYLPWATPVVESQDAITVQGVRVNLARAFLQQWHAQLGLHLADEACRASVPLPTSPFRTFEQIAWKSEQVESLFPTRDLSPTGSSDLRPFAAELAREPDSRSNHTYSARQLFAYIFALFHSPTYRLRYADWLRIDFPRVLIPASVALFQALSQLGEILISLCLLKDPDASEWAELSERYQFLGKETHDPATVLFVEQRYPVFKEGKLWFNQDVYLAGVSSEVYEFQVGSHQVCRKWLRDRRGRSLSRSDLLEYRRIVHAISRMIVTMRTIDTRIEEAGGWPAAFRLSPGSDAGRNDAVGEGPVVS